MSREPMRVHLNQGPGFGEIISQFERSRRRPDGQIWAEGYTQSELDDA
jgi:hypothetical protein